MSTIISYVAWRERASRDRYSSISSVRTIKSSLMVPRALHRSFGGRIGVDSDFQDDLRRLRRDDIQIIRDHHATARLHQFSRERVALPFRIAKSMREPDVCRGICSSHRSRNDMIARLPQITMLLLTSERK